ncbi:hypothetical protein [Streptomyces brasiliensis]|uniref:Uncharacterized protein n=1 Tax=Streptomyces brasiliensis TaxID=1954 RepID=A0A917PE15_9ACTN|nr:hypothetical protein [Streptomyces brasiliensis]GGJ72449.1 hypothetical protein GCM10010121_098820 [Streptomyces brasiliensis]
MRTLSIISNVPVVTPSVSRATPPGVAGSADHYAEVLGKDEARQACLCQGLHALVGEGMGCVVVAQRPSSSKPDRGVVEFEVRVTNQHDVVAQHGIKTMLIARKDPR